MPFKTEALMKQAINAVEQGVGAGIVAQNGGWLCNEGVYCAVGISCLAMGISIGPTDSTAFFEFEDKTGLSSCESGDIAIAFDDLGPAAAVEKMRSIGFEA